LVVEGFTAFHQCKHGSPHANVDRTRAGDSMTTVDSIRHVPSHVEAREMLAAKAANIVLDRGDLAAMTRVLAEIEQFRAKAERSIAQMSVLRIELASLMEMLRLQLK